MVNANPCRKAVPLYYLYLTNRWIVGRGLICYIIKSIPNYSVLLPLNKTQSKNPIGERNTLFGMQQSNERKLQTIGKFRIN